MVLVHTPQVTGKNHGKPWCEAEGEAVLSEDDDEVTCPECVRHLEFCEEGIGPQTGTLAEIDWYGEE